jgi:hypothetical protein
MGFDFSDDTRDVPVPHVVGGGDEMVPCSRCSGLYPLEALSASRRTDGFCVDCIADLRAGSSLPLAARPR